MPVKVPRNVESISSHAARSTTNSLWPRRIISAANSLSPALFWKVPRPLMRTHADGPATPTWTDEMELTVRDAIRRCRCGKSSGELWSCYFHRYDWVKPTMRLFSMRRQRQAVIGPFHRWLSPITAKEVLTEPLACS